MKNYLFLMMGGSGTRLGADRPKQYIEIDGKPIFAYIAEAYSRMEQIDCMVIVSNAMWLEYVREWIDRIHTEKRMILTAGGETRSHSILNGLNAIRSEAQDDDIILFHDATHPYVDEQGTVQVIDAVKAYGGATLGAFQYDTVYRMNADHVIQNVVPRQEIVAGASPEGFRFGDIYSIYTKSSDEDLARMTSAGAIALAHGIPMKVVEAGYLNLKITYPNDLDAFRKICHAYFFTK